MARSVTAIDLGSNTFRAVVLACDTLEKRAEYEKIVRTADGLVETGRISDAAVERIVAAAREAAEKIGFDGTVRAVTTEAIRQAENTAEVLRKIRDATGIDFEIIDGESEARYTLLAVRHRLQKLALSSECFVMVDIGGGSTEILFVEGDRVKSKSFPVGIVTIAQRYGTLEKIEKALGEEMAQMRLFVEACRREGFCSEPFVATAGTPTTVAAMMLGMEYATYDAKRINGTVVTRADLHTQLQRLLGLDEEVRRRLVGVGREDLIAAGILIFAHIYRILGTESAIVVDDGLREGVAIAECRRLMHRNI